jgi:hypothetical protein
MSLSNYTDKSKLLMSSGLTVSEFESKARDITREIYSRAFQKGLPMYYKDARTKEASHFIRANPDGSEDLVSFIQMKREYLFIQPLASAGEGYWSEITP